jgi:hypothetical protein
VKKSRWQRKEKKKETRTQWNVVIRVHGHILPYLDVIDGLEDGETVAHTAHAQFFQLCML